MPPSEARSGHLPLLIINNIVDPLMIAAQSRDDNKGGMTVKKDNRRERTKKAAPSLWEGAAHISSEDPLTIVAQSRDDF